MGSAPEFSRTRRRLVKCMHYNLIAHFRQSKHPFVIRDIRKFLRHEQGPTGDPMTDNIQVETRDRITRIGLNRPDKKNAITLAMYQAIADAIRAADEDRNSRVVLLHGTGDCFSAGNDIVDFLKSPAVDDASPVVQFMSALTQSEKPIVAAVNGLAIGIGVTMLLHCDLVYAGKSARLQLPFVNIGISPECGSSLLMPNMMGHQRAAELILLGEMFGADKAREVGIVNEVVDDATVMDTALKMAGKLAAQPPHSL